MAKSHGKNARILFAEFDLSNYFRNADVSRSAALADATAFQDGWDKSVVGILGGKVTLDGFFDGAIDAVDEELDAAFGSDAGHILTLGAEGSAEGKRVKMLLAKDATYAVRSPFNDIVQVSAEVIGDGSGPSGGLFLHGLSTETTSSNTAPHDHGAATSNGGVGHLHVTTVSGTTPSMTMKIQHSVDNAVWADLLTFTAVTARTAERLTVPVGTTINRYTRTLWSVSGTGPSFTLAVAFSRL